MAVAQNLQQQQQSQQMSLSMQNGQPTLIPSLLTKTEVTPKPVQQVKQLLPEAMSELCQPHRPDQATHLTLPTRHYMAVAQNLQQQQQSQQMSLSMQNGQPTLIPSLLTKTEVTPKPVQQVKQLLPEAMSELCQPHR